MTLLAALFGVEELYGLVAASGAAMVTAALWTQRRGRLDLAVRTDVVPRRTAAGTRASARVVLDNAGRRYGPPLVIGVPLRRFSARPESGVAGVQPAGTNTFGLPGLAPVGQADATFKLPRARRGLWVVGPVTATLSDPLGLTEKSWTSQAETHFAVHPEVYPLAVPPQLAAAVSPGSARRYLPAQRGDEPRALREYEDGDEMRRIHWRSTARWDRLMVRQDEAETGCVVCIGLDLRGDRQTPGSLERSLEAAASIASMVLGQPSGEVRLTTTLGERCGPGSGDRTRDRILDLLAAAQVHNGGPVGPLFGGRAEMAVLISPTEDAAGELLARESTGTLRSVMAVLTDEAPSDRGTNVVLHHLPYPAGPVVMLKVGQGLEPAWAAAIGRTSRPRRPATPALAIVRPQPGSRDAGA
jgi:uncharacterized protein (DUF58 family)